jgi:UDP-3-O-[3-hydroxymyristoyl] glucosamine N-acyltransferase
VKISKLVSLLEDVTYHDSDFEIKAINTLSDATANEISFFDNKKYLESLKTTKAAAVFIAEEYVSFLPKNTAAIISKNPYLAMAQATQYFAKPLIREGEKSFIDKEAFIGENVHIGNGVHIEKNVTILSGSFIGEGVVIGEGSLIHPNVTLYNDTLIGKSCIIHAGAVIGSDGFGYAHTNKGAHIKIHHNGHVVLEDDVEIGANSAIDRAVFATTRIKSGTKIDNLVQIGHNCDIGAQCIIVSQAGISGSSTLGQNVVMGGQSATAGHLEIGDFATIAARGGVTKSIEGGKVYSGFPLMLHKEWLKQQAKITKFFKKE